MKTFKTFLEEELVNGSKGTFFKVKLSTSNKKYSLSTLPEQDRDAIRKIIRDSKLPEPFKIIRFLAKPDGTVYIHGADLSHRDLLKRAEPSSSSDLKKMFAEGSYFPGQCDLDWNFIGEISPENINKQLFLKTFKTPEEMAEEFFNKFGYINSFVKDFLVKNGSTWKGDLWSQFINQYIFN